MDLEVIALKGIMVLSAKDVAKKGFLFQRYKVVLSFLGSKCPGMGGVVELSRMYWFAYTVYAVEGDSPV